jgi:uridine phosphorylase
MTRRPALGSYIVADRAFIHEGTSLTYAVDAPSVDLDPNMADALEAACAGLPVVRGTVASCDGFYTQMTDLLADVPADLVAHWDAEGVLGLDMETSALASVARALDVSFGSLCLATVDVAGPVMLAAREREAGESRLMSAALDVVTTARVKAGEPRTEGRRR